MNHLFAECDLHVHTRFSPCGHEEMVPAAILETVKRRGIRYLGVTDHLHTNTDIDALLAVRKQFGEPQDVSFFFGCEADIDAVGVTPATSEIAARFDYIMVAPTHFQLGFGRQLEPSEPDMVADYLLELFTYAVGLEFADTVAHPFMIAPNSRFSVLSQDFLTDKRLAPSLELAKERGVAMEVSRRALLPGQEEFYLRFYKLCKRIGLKFSVGSDAHALADAGQTRILAPLIRDVGITDNDVWMPAAP